MNVIKDEFLTINGSSEGVYKEKGSKFLAYVYPTSSIHAVSQSLEALKSIHPKARHICYAYNIGLGDQAQFRINDDGEPSGTAGRPIYNEILSANLTDVLIAVVRYFGGTKLGASGLINAYRQSSKDAVLQGKIIKKYIYQNAKITFSHSQLGLIFNSLKQKNIEITDKNISIDCWITIGIRKSEYENRIIELLAHFHNLSKDHVIHESFKSQIKIEKL